jgi:quercetin dioxygenase-like cupin family protein
MTHHHSPSAPRLSYYPTEAWGEGVLLALLNLGQDEKTFPFRASRFVLEPGSASPVDEHSVAEIWMTASGSGHLLYNDSRYEMSAGDVFYMEPGAKHQAINTSAESMEIFSIWWSR